MPAKKRVVQPLPQARTGDRPRDTLQDILADEDQEALRWWCKRAKLSRLGPFRELAQSIQEHWSGVVAFLKLDLPMVPSKPLIVCCNSQVFGQRVSLPALLPHNGLSESRWSSARFAGIEVVPCCPLKIANGLLLPIDAEPVEQFMVHRTGK